MVESSLLEGSFVAAKGLGRPNPLAASPLARHLKTSVLAQHDLFTNLKGNSRLILTIFCIDVDIGWINFTGIIYIDDE